MDKKDILTIIEPFTYTELKKIGFAVSRKDLAKLVNQGKLECKKIGRMNVYWIKPSQLKKSDTTLNSYTSQLELELNELKQELMAERNKVRMLSIQNGIDEPWKEAAMAMARILSEQKQVPLQEVLDYFNTPSND
ncbi:MAG: hypothetical protein ACXAC8_12890 [Candidatus Hodarchaeales archaeon]|jgi:hypothetical protein